MRRTVLFLDTSKVDANFSLTFDICNENHSSIYVATDLEMEHQPLLSQSNACLPTHPLREEHIRSFVLIDAI